ncbi:unnamed protein product [Caretta caretta]
MEVTGPPLAGNAAESSVKWQLCYNVTAKTWWMIAMNSQAKNTPELSHDKKSPEQSSSGWCREPDPKSQQGLIDRFPFFGCSQFKITLHVELTQCSKQASPWTHKRAGGKATPA